MSANQWVAWRGRFYPNQWKTFFYPPAIMERRLCLWTQQMYIGRGSLVGEAWRRGTGEGLGEEWVGVSPPFVEPAQNTKTMLLSWFPLSILTYPFNKHSWIKQGKILKRQFFKNKVCLRGTVADLELSDLEGHLPHAAHWDPVAPRREEQEFLLEALAVVLQNLPQYRTWNRLL